MRKPEKEHTVRYIAEVWTERNDPVQWEGQSRMVLSDVPTSQLKAHTVFPVQVLYGAGVVNGGRRGRYTPYGIYLTTVRHQKGKKKEKLSRTVGSVALYGIYIKVRPKCPT